MIELFFSFGFLTKALLVGCFVSIIGGPIGSLMIWKRLSYFGDTLAHSTLLGFSLALLLNINIYVGLISICVLTASLLIFLSKHKKLANDAVLGILSHTMLALGLITATLLKGVKIDLLSYLYGDILSVTNEDLLIVFVVSIIILITLINNWKNLISSTVHNEIAKVEGVPVKRMKWLFILMLALVFAVAMKLIGVLLITALLVIPAAAARQFARSPEAMALFASLIGCMSVMSGLLLSLYLDWPTGPSIVVAATILFSVSLIKNRLFSVYTK